MREYIDRLLLGVDARLLEDACCDTSVYARVRLATMSLDDCADFATLLVRGTMEMQRFTVGLRGVGGPIHLATVTQGDGVRRWTVPGAASVAGVPEIGSMLTVETEPPADGARPTSYTMTERVRLA